MSLSKTALTVLMLAALQLFAGGVKAQPVVVAAGLQTNRIGQHSLSEWLPIGDKLEVIALIEFGDPAGSPTISVQATRGSASHGLEYVGDHPLYEPFAVKYYDTFLDFDLSLTGSWEITAVDSTGIGLPYVTDPIFEPEFLPLVENVKVRGTPLGTSISWTLPNLDGLDADDIAIRLIDATTGSHLWQSEALTLGTTNFQPPAGVIQKGVEYVYSIILGDLEDGIYENLSWTFSPPFRMTVEGDYNQDGQVNAADYTVWRDRVGTESLLNRGVGILGPVGMDDYDVWKSNFGQTLIGGSSSQAVIPEPATVLFVMVGAAMICCWRCANLDRSR